MRVLILSQWFDPEPTFKGLLFAKELQRRGHEVQVLTGLPNYPGGQIYSGYKLRPFQREILQGIPVYRTALYPSHDSSPLRRVLNYASFAASASVAAMAIPRPDVAYVYHPPATVAIPAYILRLFRGVPFVYDVQDLWPDTLRATGMLTSRLALAAIDIFMRHVYRRADAITVLSTGFARTLESRDVPAEKITVIHNWADEAQISVPTKADIPSSKRPPSFDVVFAGTMGPAQGLETVLKAAELLAHERTIRFILVGDGIDKRRLLRRATEMGLRNVVFRDRVPLSEVGEVLGQSSALLVHLRDDPLFEITVPSKTQAYLFAGRPILMGVDGDASEMVTQARAGITFRPEDPKSLARAVLRLAETAPDERWAMGARGREFYGQQLALPHGAARFEQVFERTRLSRPHFDSVKRSADVAVSAAGLLVGAGPMALLALLVRRSLGSPAIFRQIRPGRYGQPFQMLKFRTMTEQRSDDGTLLPDRERLTPFGSFLRKSSLDELPTLWNVLRGDMSLVGPRPLLPRYTPYFTAVERLRFLVRPGITGLAQVSGRNRATWNDRLALDVSYVRHRSTPLDLKVIAKTIRSVSCRTDVVVDAESTMQNLDVERSLRSV